MRQSREKTSDSSPTKCEPDAKRDPLGQVLQWVLDGGSERDVRQATAAHFPGEDAEALILKALRSLEESASRWKDTAIGFCFEATRELYRKMLEIGDYPGSLRALKQMLEMTARLDEATTTKQGNEVGLHVLDIG